ncbi:hypothetical protein QE380_000195 [Acinetobacter baylyi]|uniref:HK97 gp10 family phage protein n=1 Tax=Acinetobacter baylyi TaxID=202950 RepID=A0ABU0URV3_ACIBI|nr:hypothetical protein [Acinetobacter baylyi]MDQ1207272.1 hypothetical protein [Acinetobacter baylyi]MDR6105646.1 hypothetical protein [Acinetobacter baylyi]MDR6187633.1 hypothetical protein [Acinetobacter baylyi]
MSWKNKPTDFIKVIEQNLTQTQKKIVVEVLQGVVMSSPVDTGAFRGNHRVSVGSIDQSANESEKDKSGTGTIAKGLQNLITLRPFQTVYISNSLPYALRLENGWSNQAPVGVYKTTFNYIVQKYGG